MIDRSGCPASRHGDRNAYTNAGCRCPDAREAYRLYMKRRREGRLELACVSPVGTRRRIQALWALGHTSETIARIAGVHPRHVERIGSGRTRSVKRTTVAAVTRAYDALSLVVGESKVTRNRARRAGYAPPLAWDDETIDDPSAEPQSGSSLRRAARNREVDHAAVARACQGDMQWDDLSWAEKRAVVAKLTQSGLTDGEIAALLGTRRHTVGKFRERHGIPSEWKGVA